jgi:transposase-like protein
MRSSAEERRAMLDLIEQWKQSGLNQKDFYQQHNIPAHVFYYWHKCYRKQRSGLNTSVSSNGFVQLEPSEVPLVGNIELQLANGNRIIFHQPVGVDYLKALML